MKIKMNLDGTFPALTKGQITELALIQFRAMGFDCWRNNNIPVKRRQFIGRKGVPDIIGFGKNGILFSPGCFFGAEGKTENDSLSKEQKEFLISLNQAGGYGYVFEDDGKGGIKYYLYLNDKS